VSCFTVKWKDKVRIILDQSIVIDGKRGTFKKKNINISYHSHIRCNYIYVVLLIVVQSTSSLKMYQLQHRLGANFHGINNYPDKNKQPSKYSKSIVWCYRSQ
jgi:hypothetical protein